MFGYVHKRLVEKLNLLVIPHPKPYKLQWLSEDGEIKVANQVLLNFSIGKYKDELFCDVVPRKHVIYCCKAHDQMIDMCTMIAFQTSFLLKKKKRMTYSLSLLTPKEVRRYNLAMKESREKSNNSNPKAWKTRSNSKLLTRMLRR